MSRGDFRAALGEADRALERAGMPAAVDRRLRARLSGSPEGQLRAVGLDRRPRRRLFLPLLLTGAAAAAAVLVLALRPHPPAMAGGLVVEAPSGDLALADAAATAGAPVEIVRGRCLLRDRSEGSTITVVGPARLVKEPAGLRVLRGRVEVAVAKRKPGQPPARVLISAGIIEVRGTRFTVEQRDGVGQVLLHEGAIRFLASDGRQVDIEPGRALAWPLPALAPPAPPAVRPPAPAAHRPPHLAAEPEPVDHLLQRVAVLRSRAMFAGAVRELERALRAPYGAVARERLSYEMGSLLTYQIGDRGRACAHWRVHLGIFGKGRYDREVAQAREILGCPAER